MLIEQLEVGFIANFCYIVGDEKTKEGLIIDPAWEIDKILTKTKQLDLNIKYIIGTHNHPDHIGALEEISRILNAKTIMHKNDNNKVDLFVNDNDVLEIGHTKFQIIHTPGHTKGGICLYSQPYLFTGDTLFSGGGYGRIDLPGGNGQELQNSLHKLFLLPDNTIIYAGHNYGSTKTSTIKQERELFFGSMPSSS